MNSLDQRVQYVAESFLENEGLTDDLNDPAAKELLDWGIARGEAIARSTAGLDDAAAEEAMYPRLKAMRKLMRHINRWLPRRARLPLEDQEAMLDEVIEQATRAYGESFAPPAPEDCAALLHRLQQADDVQAIAVLRAWIEPPSEEGERDDQEEEHVEDVEEQEEQQVEQPQKKKWWRFFQKK